MTEAAEEFSTEEKELTTEELKLELDDNSVDWFLQNLVGIVNKSTLEIGITLVVGGSIVSGRLVGGKKYFETFAREFSEAWNGESKESIYDAFAKHGERYVQDDDEEKQNSSPPQFIHLIDSRCFLPGQQPLPTNKGVLWRGKINAVSGFSLGLLSTDPDAQG